MLGYDIRMEGEIKALFLHQAALAGAAFSLFLVAKIAVLLFAFIGLVFWDLKIPSRGEEDNLYVPPTPPPLPCVLIAVYISADIFYLHCLQVTGCLFKIKFLLIFNPGHISQKNPLSYCSAQALFPFLKHVAEQFSCYFLYSRETF